MKYTTLSWDEQLALYSVGICIGGFVFSGILQSWLAPPYRPSSPVPAMGFTHVFNTKYGSVYGTYFEYLAVTYGIWTSWGTGTLGGLFYFSVKNRLSPGYPRQPWQVLAGAVLSLPLYYAVWRIAALVARS